MNKKYQSIDALNQVALFHKTFQAPVIDTPAFPSKERCNLRVSLLQEELDELKEAIEANDLVEVADALCDLQYVLAGAVLEFGMGDKFKELFDEVQRSNMSKACESLTQGEETQQFYRERDDIDTIVEEQENGSFLVFRKSDRKVLKNVYYSPANLEFILNK